MTIEDALTTWLLSKSSVTSLLNTSTTSIFTDKASLNHKRPFIYVELESNNIEYHTQGMQTLARARIRCHCEGTTRTIARNIAEQIRLLFINGLQETLSTLEVRNGMILDLFDRPSNLVGGKEAGLPAVVCDLEIYYQMPTS